MQIHLPDNSWKSWINTTVNRKNKVNIFLCCRWSSKSFLWSVIWIEENKESPLFEKDWNDFLYSTFLQQLFNMCRFLFLLCHVCMLQKYGSQNITRSTSAQYSICLCVNHPFSILEITVPDNFHHNYIFLRYSLYHAKQ